MQNDDDDKWVFRDFSKMEASILERILSHLQIYKKIDPNFSESTLDDVLKTNLTANEYQLLQWANGYDVPRPKWPLSVRARFWFSRVL